MDMHRITGLKAALLAAIVLSWGAHTACAQENTFGPTVGDPPAPQQRMRRILHSERKAAAARLLKQRAEGGSTRAGEGFSTLAVPEPGVDLISPTPEQIRQAGVPDYFGVYPNYANSPLPQVTTDDRGVVTNITGGMRKFVDHLAGLGAANANGLQTLDENGVPTDPLGQYISVAKPDQVTFPGCDYYEISVREYRERMHSDLPATGARLRGYVQTNNGIDEQTGAITPPDPIHYLGPVIVAQRDRPVRIKWTNELPYGVDPNTGERLGDLFIPTDITTMGAGDGPNEGPEEYTQNRVSTHLHGGNTPWISDGTPHQWIVPAGEYPHTSYQKGVSVANVPDMWFRPDGTLIPGSHATAPEEGATNDPGPGRVTFFYTNEQSARLLFYHEHALGITRLGVYAGLAAGYIVRDQWEQELIANGVIPADEIPLVLQDKSWVPDNTQPYTNVWGTFPSQLDAQDPTWNTDKWGGPGNLWYPHIYVPLQNAFEVSGVNHMGRWHYSKWFWPPFEPAYGLIPNPYAAADTFPAPWTPPAWEPPVIPTLPNPSGVAEAFFDTPVINGTAYPYLDVEPKAYRFRILNAANDRFWNLQLYVADPNVTTFDGRADTEVKMVPAVATPGFPGHDPLSGNRGLEALTTGTRELQRWPTDNRDGGVPDPYTQGPPIIQIGAEAGFLPAPVVIHPQPVDWNTDMGTFDAGVLNTYALMMGPAERADVIIDFSQFAGQTLILYNDSPAPVPAPDPREDCYTGMPDQTDVGGPPTTQAGWGPNTRTIMQIRVADTKKNPSAYDLASLQATFASTVDAPGVFAKSQKTIIVPQEYYNSAYNQTFPLTLAGIFSNTLTFTPIGAAVPVTLPLTPKSIQDEMGETFDPEYGRMAAKMGVEQPKTTATTLTTILYSFFDPPTEVILPSLTMTPIAGMDDGTQIWKITQNGVDTHAMHFHMFDVQLINRVSWANNVREPDPNELGWKDTVKVRPLQDTIVALRPIMPTNFPFQVPNSIRPMAPAMPLGAPLMDIFGGAETVNPQGDPVTITNQLINLGWEYVWHCHLLAHEENDMMRAIAVAPVPEAPSDLHGVVAAGPQVVLTWTNNSKCCTGYVVQRADDPNFTAGVTEWSVTWGLTEIPVTTYADATIVLGQTYYYRVFATNMVGATIPGFPLATTNSAYSPTMSITPTAPGPAAPTNLVATLTAPTQVDLSWGYTQGEVLADSFRIERSTNGGAFAEIGTAPIANANYTDATVTDGTTYVYRVFAVAGTSDSLPSNTAVITTPTPPPAAPANLTATLVEPRQVNLSWDYVQATTPVDSFRIERSTNGGAFAEIGTAPIANANYTDATVTDGTTYAYRVLAVAGTVSSQPSNTVAIDTPAIAAPTGLQVAGTGPRTVDLTWTDNSPNNANFRIARSPNGADNWLEVGTVAGDITSFRDTGLTRRTTYYYRVQAFTDATASGWSNTVQATTR